MAPTDAPCIYPSFRYRDAVKMIDWLCDAYGFTVHAKYMDGDKVAHAQLVLGSSMIMLGSVRDDKYGRMVGEPGGSGAGNGTYIAVENTEEVYRKAKGAGARILEEPTDRDYGSREFICADPEGHVWSFGTYWPKTSDPSH